MNHTITKAYLIEAAVSEVYEKWLSNDTVIPPATKMNIDPVIGGEYVLVANLDDMEMTMTGIFQEIIVNKKLVYTWEWNKDGNISVITVIFSVDGNAARVELTHEGFQDEDTANKHSEGWDSYIEGFKNSF